MIKAGKKEKKLKSPIFSIYYAKNLDKLNN